MQLSPNMHLHQNEGNVHFKGLLLKAGKLTFLSMSSRYFASKNKGYARIDEMNIGIQCNCEECLN